MVQRDKASRDIFWLDDKGREIVESLETALKQFRGIEDEPGKMTKRNGNEPLWKR